VRRPAFLSSPRALPAVAIGALGLVDLTVGRVVPRSAPLLAARLPRWLPGCVGLWPRAAAAGHAETGE
jgi:hypothetical protein